MTATPRPERRTATPTTRTQDFPYAAPRGADPAPHAPEGARAPSPALLEATFDAQLPDAALDCRLRITPAASTCTAILAGLAMLQRAGRIRLELEIVPDAPPLDHGPWHLRDKQRPQAVLETEGGGTAVIDAHDSHEIEADDLARHDLYFKRSLAPESLLLPGGEKLRALALLNDVRTDFLHAAEMRSEIAAAASLGGRGAALLRWLATTSAARLGFGGRPNWSRMHAPPAAGQPQRVLLMAGLWDPEEVPAEATRQRAEREAMNRMRVDCIRALRRAFGARFHGGVRPDGFARRFAPDVVLRSPREASRREFLRRVREHCVCVTSAGLHGSNGWRLAEYVAFSRAIVSEPLQYAVAGDLVAERNYLEYTSPEECVARVAWLFDRPDAREEMARRNWEYHARWQQPDRIAARLVALTWSVAKRRQSVVS